MISINPESLLQFMQQHQYESGIQTDTQQVYTIFKMHQREYPLFLRAFDDGNLLQILVFIPNHLEPNGPLSPSSESQKQGQNKAIIADLARLLHLFNKELDVPGFGMDEMAGVVFYRFMLPTPTKKTEEDLLLTCLKTAERVCEMFSKPIEAVSSGQMTLDQILARAQESGTPPHVP